LDNVCKRYKINKKNRKEKRRKQNKNGKGLRETFWPRSGSSPQPTRLNPEGVSLFLSSTNDRWDPPIGTFFSNGFPLPLW
jgi:hypothetical protein